MKTVLVSGGSGMIGSKLAEMLLQRNYRVIILGRSNSYNKIVHPHLSYSQWNVEQGEIDKEVVQKSNYIIHLAGANVAEKRWTKKRKKEILESRTKSGALLLHALASGQNNLEAFISASAIGYYGKDRVPGATFKEDDEPGSDFLARTCIQWENSVHPVKQMGKRLVILRTGLVISRKEGLLKSFLPIIKFRIAPVLGNGSQMMSPIHLDDMCRMYVFALENDLEGVYNAAASEICSNKIFIARATRLLFGQPFFNLPVPKVLLKIVLGEMATEILKSTSVNVDKIKSAGFRFLYPTIDDQLMQEKNK